MPIFPCFDHGGMADRRISIHSPPCLAFSYQCVCIAYLSDHVEERQAQKARCRENTHLVFGRRRGKASKPAEKCAWCTRHTDFSPGHPSSQQPTDIIAIQSSKDTRQGGLCVEIRRSAIPPWSKHGEIGTIFTLPRNIS